MAQRLVAGKRPNPGIAALIFSLLVMLGGCAATPTSTLRGPSLAGNWVTIQRGNTLGAIARQADIPLLRLQRFNPRASARHLAVGQRILVPTRRERAPSGGPYRYQVRPGDTFTSIARHFRTTAYRIRSANRRVSPNSLRVGQLLRVPLRGAPSRSVVQTPSKPRPAPKPTTVPAAPTPVPAKPAVKPQAKAEAKPARQRASKPASSLPRNWPWPLKSYQVVRRFGTDSHGTLQPMLLSTDKGSQARTVADGQVRFASSMRQLGRVVIVHHANNLQTIYALCDTLKVSAGQHIKAGTPVCTVGYSGATKRHDLLFDVRRGGKPVNPRKVLR